MSNSKSPTHQVVEQFQRTVASYDVLDAVRHMRPKPLALHQTNPAEHTKLGILKRVWRFERTLTPDQEIGAIVSAGNASNRIWLTAVEAEAPFHIVLEGWDADGQRTQILQHYTQVDITLTALKKREDEPRRIGFR